MKRSYIKRKAAPVGRQRSGPTDYDKEFAKAKPAVKQRSRGRCEAASFVANRGRWHYVEGGPEALASFREVTCAVRGEHIHHRKYRSRGGSNDLGNLIHLCDAHHTWTHSRGKFSHLLGLSVKRGEPE